MADNDSMKLEYTRSQLGSGTRGKHLVSYEKSENREAIRNKLINAEQGGFSNLTRDEILSKARALLDSDEKL